MKIGKNKFRERYFKFIITSHPSKIPYHNIIFFRTRHRYLLIHFFLYTFIVKSQNKSYYFTNLIFFQYSICVHDPSISKLIMAEVFKKIKIFIYLKRNNLNKLNH